MIRNIEKINSVKRDMVLRSLFAVSDNSDIEKVIVFGSSVRDDCGEDSDVDFCFFLTPGYNKKNYCLTLGKVCKECNYIADTLRADTMSKEMFEKVQKRGVVVYDRLS